MDAVDMDTIIRLKKLVIVIVGIFVIIKLVEVLF
jgi:hypothetical protein